MHRGFAAAIAGAALLFAARAHAEKVAVLPFTSTSGAASTELDEARAATRAALTARGDTLPSDSEMLTAQMSSKDGVVDSSGEYRAAGRASGATWTLAGHVDPHGPTYRLELEACLVESGRVESLAREIDPAQAASEIGEMLALLVRPEGIANADIPWNHAAPPVKPPPAPVPAPAKEEKAAAPESIDDADRRPRYAHAGRFALGPSLTVLGAIARPSNASGSSAAALVGGTLAYVPADHTPIELRVDAQGAAGGPRSFSFDLGARYAAELVPTFVYAGPEVTIGGFFPLGANTTGRFLGRAAVFVSLALADRFQIEFAPELDVAPAHGDSLLLGGASLRALVRF